MGETAVGIPTKEYEVAEKIPTPEEVFRMPQITWPRKIAYIWGPAVISLGLSIGAGEFIFGPAAAIKVGLSVLWIVLLAAFFQLIFAYSYGKFTLITGETPITMFSRIGLWAGFLGALLYLSVLAWGGLVASSAAAIVGGVLGRTPGPAEKNLVAFVGILLLVLVVIITLLGGRIARTLEIVQWWLVFIMLGFFILLAVIFTPPSVYAEAARGLVSFGSLPPGADLPLLAALWAYTAHTSALTYVMIAYYKDKGFGMASLTGYIPGVIGGKKVLVPAYGKMFKLTPENLSVFERWKRLMAEELVIIFFLGALIGMLAPTLVAYSLAKGLGIEIAWGIPLWLAMALGKIWGGVGWWIGVLVAIAVLLSTQLAAMDTAARNMVDAVWKIGRVREVFRNDIRYVYYIILIIILAWSSLALFLKAPMILLLIAANSANAGAFFSIPALLYINYKFIPKELRLHWSLVVANIIFMVLCIIFLIAAVGRTLGVW